MDNENIKFLQNTFTINEKKPAIIWREKIFKYWELKEKVNYFDEILKSHKVIEGMIVALVGDFSPNSISILLNLIQKNCIVVPLTNSSKDIENNLLNISKAEIIIKINSNDNVDIKSTNFNNFQKKNKYYNIITKRKHPGLVLFTSGTSGEPKAAVHDFLPLLEKFKMKRLSLRTLNFLLFDHWGGLNTMFYILSNGGTVITTKVRKPKEICELIERHKIELLPASPTFLNLLLISGLYEDYDLSSLKIISYGTEPMPENTLKKLEKKFPKVKLQQTYGLIELGVMRSKSEKNNSLWVKVGGDGFRTRIINGMLQIKAKSSMLGYLNAPSPFTNDGWFITGDQVEQKGEYIKILGRKSEIINVGGEKVYPQEVENIIHEIDNVSEVTVYGEKNPLVGNIVCAKISLKKLEEKKLFISTLKKHCKKSLQPFKVPVKISIVNSNQHNARFKKIRKNI